MTTSSTVHRCCAYFTNFAVGPFHTHTHTHGTQTPVDTALRYGKEKKSNQAASAQSVLGYILRAEIVRGGVEKRNALSVTGRCTGRHASVALCRIVATTV